MKIQVSGLPKQVTELRSVSSNATDASDKEVQPIPHPVTTLTMRNDTVSSQLTVTTHALTKVRKELDEMKASHVALVVNAGSLSECADADKACITMLQCDFVVRSAEVARLTSELAEV